MQRPGQRIFANVVSFNAALACCRKVRGQMQSFVYVLDWLCLHLASACVCGRAYLSGLHKAAIFPAGVAVAVGPSPVEEFGATSPS